MDVFNKVSPGDPLRIKAGTWNGVMDATRAVLAGRPAGLGSALPGVGTPLRDAVTILVRNDSGSDLDPLSVVGLGAPVVTPTDNETEFRENAALAASVPDADTDAGRFAILLEGIPAGEFGRALLAGVTAVKLQVGDADHRFADVTDGDASKLTTAEAGGAQILWKEAGTGTKWGLVRLGVPDGAAAGLWAKLTQTWGTDTTGTTIEAHPCADADGNGEDLATTLTLDILPPDAAWEHPADPHVDWIVPVLAEDDVVRYVPYGADQGTLVGVKWADNGPWENDPDAVTISWHEDDWSWEIWLKFDSTGRLIEAKESGPV